MELSAASKKKKRRTRKCLDEIRKRSQLTNIKTSLQHDKPKKAEVISHRLITMNRLTLNMLPKAICSKTITRPLLEELRQQSSNNDCEEFQENSKSPMRSEVKSYDNISMASNNSMPLFDLEEEILREHAGSDPIEIPLKDSLNQHSPTHSNIVEAPAELMTRTNSRSTSPSSQTLDEHPGTELYEELMNNISSHLRKVTSAINIKEDIINNTKINLHMLFTKSRSKEYQLHMLEHEKGRKSKETNMKSPNIIPIVQNPMDYIKLKHQLMYDECCTGSSKSFSPLSPPPAPQTSERDCLAPVNLFDTPEYNYYPHRLN